MRHTRTNTEFGYREWLTIATRRRYQRVELRKESSTNVLVVRWRRAIVTATAVCTLLAGCGDGADDVDLSKLNVGTYSTAARTIPNPPSLPDGTVREGIRMWDAVADTSQFGSPLI